LGVYFWSRLAVTFDFPGRRVLLRKGAGYGRLDRWHLGGLHILGNGDSVVIESVDVGSVGQVAGARKGDFLMKLGDLPGTPSNLFKLRSTLCAPGRIECIVRRSLTNHVLTLNIASSIRTETTTPSQ
jgi:hypothetical protein